VVALGSVDVGDEADPAGIVLVGRVVEALSGRQILAPAVAGNARNVGTRSRTPPAVFAHASTPELRGLLGTARREAGRYGGDGEVRASAARSQPGGVPESSMKLEEPAPPMAISAGGDGGPAAERGRRDVGDRAGWGA